MSTKAFKIWTIFNLFYSRDPQYLTVGQNAKIQFTTAACKGTADAVNFLEQIEVASTIDYPHRGALSITITSPAG